MTTKELRELDAWIEINVFGKHCVSEKRGDYEWFYFVNSSGRLGHQDKSDCAKRDWSEYNPMKHILPDSQPSRFTTDPAASDVLDDVILNHPQGNHRIELVNGIYYFTSTVNPNIGCEHPDKKTCRALFAQKLFSK